MEGSHEAVARNAPPDDPLWRHLDEQLASTTIDAD
jgi:hypothetical protein